jgi:MFS family permease
MYSKTNAVVSLLLLTALNFLNYIDRNILFAVQPMIQKEFRLSDMQVGLITTAFIVCYMVAAPLIVPLADRYPRKWVMAAGAFLWGLGTLLSATTHNYHELLVRYVIVGIGEATFVATAQAFLSDLFPEAMRGRVLALFYLAIPVGSAMGYMVGGELGQRYGWRAPFLISALPALAVAFGILALHEPVRGASDHLADNVERGTMHGLFSNRAYWTVTLGMAMMLFAMGGLKVWMPTFLTRIRCVPLDRANLVFGSITVIAGTAATLFGGWFGDRLLPRTSAAYQMLSAIGMAASIPAILIAIWIRGPAMYPAIFLSELFLLVNTAPLNAALVNSVSSRIRATALAVNIFIIHSLGDAFSPALIGYVSDKSNLQIGLTSVVPAVALSAAVLFYGMRFAPWLEEKELAASG